MGFITAYEATTNRFITELGQNIVLAEIDRNLLQKVNSEYDLLLYYIYNNDEAPGLATWLILLDLLSVDSSDPDWDLTWEELRAMFVPSSLGEANTSSNLGSGVGLFTTKSGVNLPFKSLIEGTNVSFDVTGTDITINSTGGGETNTASNLGTGEGLATTKAGVDLPFKSLIEGTNISFDVTSTGITINATGSSDADTLEGEAGAYYLDYNNFTNIPTIESYTFENGLIESGGTVKLGDITEYTSIKYSGGVNYADDTWWDKGVDGIIRRISVDGNVNGVSQMELSQALAVLGITIDIDTYISCGVNHDGAFMQHELVGAISVGTGSIEVEDYRTVKRGLGTAADYSANVTDNDYVTKKYVDDNSASTYTFENGLTENGGVGKLGGSLTGYTSIAGDEVLEFGLGIPLSAFFVTTSGNQAFNSGTSTIPGGSIRIRAFDGLGSGENATLFVGLTETTMAHRTVADFTMSSATDTAIFQDFRSSGSKKGIEYSADYSADYTNRSLVDKEYVDSLLAAPAAPAGTDKQIQYNDNGTANGSSLMFDSSLNTKFSGGVLGINTSPVAEVQLKMLYEGGYDDDSETYKFISATYINEDLSEYDLFNIHAYDGAGRLRVREITGAKDWNTGAVDVLRLTGPNVELFGGRVAVCNSGQGISFFGKAGTNMLGTITGSRGGNAALASLLTTLDNYGLINDITT